MMFKTIRNISLALLLVAHSTEPLLRYRKLIGRRCNNAGSVINSVSAATDLRCAEACQETTDCNSFNYNTNSAASTSNCELLMTSAVDYDALSSDASWNAYSSSPLLVSGRRMMQACFCLGGLQLDKNS